MMVQNNGTVDIHNSCCDTNNTICTRVSRSRTGGMTFDAEYVEFLITTHSFLLLMFVTQLMRSK